MILELQPFDAQSSLRFFNCSFVSSFSNLDERIIFGGRYCLKYNSIRNFKTDENFDHFLKAIQLLDDIMSDDQRIDDAKEIHDSEAEIMKLLIENKSAIPKYIKSVFDQYCNRKKKIEIDLLSLLKFIRNLSNYLWINEQIINFNR